jgi:hypothetical protein
VLLNIKTSIADEEDDKQLDFDALDGFDELSPEHQEKIKTAIEKGHIEDDEWKGVRTLTPGFHFSALTKSC